jgi:hypothetical protein
MTKEAFSTKYGERSADLLTSNDVLSRVASNLSDLQIEKGFLTSDEIDSKLNALKGYIFDFQSITKK